MSRRLVPSRRVLTWCHSSAGCAAVTTGWFHHHGALESERVML